jgi:hypothetical protein
VDVFNFRGQEAIQVDMSVGRLGVVKQVVLDLRSQVDLRKGLDLCTQEGIKYWQCYGEQGWQALCSWAAAIQLG